MKDSRSEYLSVRRRRSHTREAPDPEQYRHRLNVLIHRFVRRRVLKASTQVWKCRSKHLQSLVFFSSLFPIDICAIAILWRLVFRPSLHHPLELYQVFEVLGEVYNSSTHHRNHDK